MGSLTDTVLLCMLVEIAMVAPVTMAGRDGWGRMVGRWCGVRALTLMALAPLAVPAIPADQAFLLCAIGLAVVRSLDGRMVGMALAGTLTDRWLMRLTIAAFRVAQWAPLGLLAAFIGLGSFPNAPGLEPRTLPALLLLFSETLFVCLAAHLIAVSLYSRKAAEASAASFEDALTGAVNRRGLAAAADREIARARRTRLPISLMMLDLDGFKAVNDALGHAEGDILLERCASAISTVLRRHDVLCRFGGDEFCILMPETDMDGAATLAERVRLAVEIAGQSARRAGRPVTASLGVGCLAADEVQSLDALLQRADRALYRAKREGRNRIVRDEAIPPVSLASISGAPFADRAAGARSLPLSAGASNAI